MQPATALVLLKFLDARSTNLPGWMAVRIEQPVSVFVEPESNATCFKKQNVRPSSSCSNVSSAKPLGPEMVAECVGYGSASTFGTAYSRYVGQPPGRYARR